MDTHRFRSVVLALALVFGFVGCDDDQSGEPTMAAAPDGPVLLRDMGMGRQTASQPMAGRDTSSTPMTMIPTSGGNPNPGGPGSLPSAGQRQGMAGQMNQGGTVAPSMGGSAPSAGQVVPSAGQMAPSAGQGAPMGGAAMPVAGQMNPVGGQVAGGGQVLMGGQMVPQGGQAQPQVRNVTPMDSLLINEVMANPNNASDDVAEWIELRNLEDAPIDLTGCRVVRKMDDPANDLSSPLEMAMNDGVIIEPNGYLVLSRSTDINVNGGVNANMVLVRNILVNTPPLTLTLECTDPNGGFELDRLVLNAIDAGVSVRRSDNNAAIQCPGIGDFNGQAAGDDQGTPGSANGNCP